MFLNHIESREFLRRGVVTDSEETSFPGNIFQDSRRLSQFEVSIDEIRKVRKLQTECIFHFEPLRAQILDFWILDRT